MSMNTQQHSQNPSMIDSVVCWVYPVLWVTLRWWRQPWFLRSATLETPSAQVSVLVLLLTVLARYLCLLVHFCHLWHGNDLFCSGSVVTNNIGVMIPLNPKITTDNTVRNLNSGNIDTKNNNWIRNQPRNTMDCHLAVHQKAESPKMHPPLDHAAFASPRNTTSLRRCLRRA